MSLILKILRIVLCTFIPTLELRASIPLGMFVEKMHWGIVFGIAVVANFLLGLMLYPMMDFIMKLMQKVPFVHRLWNMYVQRTQRKIHAAVERWGEFAIAAFIAVPLPGTGVYGGALAAYIIGLSFKKFIIAELIGVLVAGVLVTIFCLTGNEVLVRWFTKPA